MNNIDVLPIRMMIFDVDGILTNGDIYYDHAGESLKAFSTLDGLGLKLLQKSGIRVAIITGRDSAALHKRLDDLGIDIRYVGISDKATAFRDLLSTHNLTAKQTGYMGDDIVDLPVMICCGLAATVPEAPLLVQQYAHWITKKGGGRGAVREVCEKIMQQQGTWEKTIAHFLIPAVN